MIFVADTHSLLWNLDGDKRLSAGAREALSGPGGDLAIPLICVAELRRIENKRGLGREITDALFNFATERRAYVVPPDLEVFSHLPDGLELHDAFIVATALLLKAHSRDSVRLISCHQRIKDSGLVEVLW